MGFDSSFVFVWEGGGRSPPKIETSAATDYNIRTITYPTEVIKGRDLIGWRRRRRRGDIVCTGGGFDVSIFVWG